MISLNSAVTTVVVGNHVASSYASCGTRSNCLSGKCGYCPDLYGRNFSSGRPDGSSPRCDAAGNRLSAYF